MAVTPQDWNVFLTSESGIMNALILAASGALAWYLQLVATWLVGLRRHYSDTVDILAALEHEISSNQRYEAGFAGEGWSRKFKGKIDDHALLGRRFKGFGGSFEDNLVFDEIKKNVARLPKNCVGPVINYYNESSGLSAGVNALKTDDFAELSRSRKFEIVDNIRNIAETTRAAADEALTKMARERRICEARFHALTTSLVVIPLSMIFLALVYWPAISTGITSVIDASDTGASGGTRLECRLSDSGPDGSGHHDLLRALCSSARDGSTPMPVSADK